MIKYYVYLVISIQLKIFFGPADPLKRHLYWTGWGFSRHPNTWVFMNEITRASHLVMFIFGTDFSNDTQTVCHNNDLMRLRPKALTVGGQTIVEIRSRPAHGSCLHY